MTLVKKICLVFISASLSMPMAFAKDEQLDKIEAIVNQDIILSSDMARLQSDFVKRYQKNGQALPAAITLQQQVLDTLITQRIQLQLAERMGLRVNDAQLTQTIQHIAQEDGLTSIQLKAKIIAQGESYTAFVDSIRNELLINNVRQIRIRQRINISEQEIEKMVERIHEHGNKTTKFDFAHIMLKISKEATQQAQHAMLQKAQLLSEKIKAGENIKALAKKYSQGPKANQGGYWGWRTIADIPSLFANVFSDQGTHKGDLIGPFQTHLGYHLIKILDKKGAQKVTATEVNVRHILIKSNIILSDQKAQTLLQQYREEILAGSKTFAELAKAHSQDPGSAVKGGDLGWADPSLYVSEFKTRTQTLAIDKISAPFRTVHGWHILQVTERRESDITQSETKQKAYTMLYKQRFPAELYTWMNEIKQEAYIKIINPDFILDNK